MTPENLTLRDYFAAAAMNGLINARDVRWTATGIRVRKELANEAYAIAENMIDYRKTLSPSDTYMINPQVIHTTVIEKDVPKEEEKLKKDFKKKINKK